MPTHTAAASRLSGSNSGEDPPAMALVVAGDPSSPTPSPKIISLIFWRAFACVDKDLCRDSLRRLNQVKGGSVFSFEELAKLLAPSSSGGYPPQIGLLPGTPKSTLDSWNSTRPTSLMRVSPLEHCLALNGDVTKEHDQCYVGCAQGIAGSGRPDECTFNTHTDPSRPRIVTSGPAYAVKVPNASKATKARVLSHIILFENRRK